MFFVGAPTLLAQCTLPAPCRSLSTPLSVIPSLGLAELSSNEEPGLHYDEFPGLDYRCSPVTSEGTIWEADDMPFICSSTLQSTGETYHSETWPQNRIVCYGLEAPIPFFPENSTGTIDQRDSALTSSSGGGPPSFFDFDFGSAHSYQSSNSNSGSPEHSSSAGSLLLAGTKQERIRSRENGNTRIPILSKSREQTPPSNEQDHPHQRRRFPCQVAGCSRRFTSQYTLKVHMEAHKPKPRNSFPCTLGCSERFSRQHDRLRHEVAKHGKVCEFSCDECGRFFSTKKTLGNHKCPVAQGGTRWVNN